MFRVQLPLQAAPLPRSCHARRDRREPVPAAAAARARSGRRRPPRRDRDHRAPRLRGRGLPGPPGVRRRRPRATSTRSSTWTRWARWSTPPASPRARRGTRTAASRPSPTSSTASWTTRTPNGGGGTITNGDTQWMTAGSGHPAHRDAARVAGQLGRPVPRHPAVGEPAARPKVAPPRYQDLAVRARRPATSSTPARWCASSPATSAATTGPGLDVHADDDGARHPRPGRAARPAVAGDSTPWSTSSPARGTVGVDGRPMQHRPARGARRRRLVTSAPPSSRTAARRRST